jgi:histone H3/H4
LPAAAGFTVVNAGVTAALSSIRCAKSRSAGVRAGLRHPVIKRLARAALPESELAALPPEENAELVKRLAEEIRKAADEYQRKMGVAH